MLTPGEKLKFRTLVFFNILVSISDIVLLALLIYTVTIYTKGDDAIKISWLPASLQQHESFLLIAALLILFILKNGIAYLVSITQHRFVYGVAARMSHDNLLKYLSGEYLDYINTDSAVHIRKIGQQPIEFSNYLLMALQQIITESVLILFSITAILFFDARLFLLLFVLLIPPTILISILSRKRLRSARSHVQSSNELALQYLNEAIGGYIESCIYERKEYFSERYAAHQKRFNHFLADLQIVQNLPSRILEVFAVFGLFLLILISKLTNSTTLINVTTIGAFMAAAYKIIPGVVKIFNLSGQMKTYGFTLQSLTHANEKNDTLLKDKADKHIRSIMFRSVSFYYHDQVFLENFDLSVNPGQITGISGKSGRGKTTIINLILGFLAPVKGNILFNNELADEKERKTYWNKMAYAKQQTFLLHDTILNNIILDDKVYDHNRLQTAIAITGLQDMISKYNEGLQKVIAEKGKNISGGQRQRITLARALYKDADLLILDEPFSEMDDASMHNIMQHLIKLAGSGKAILLISHNEKTLAYCDKIVVLND